MRPWLPLLVLTTALNAAAQTATQAANAPTGTVTGHIFCADTNHPARFARVFLDPVPADADANAPKPATMPERTDTTMTTLDGSYTLTHVHPGAYYVIVALSGYINPRDLFTADQLSSPTQQVRDQLAQKLTRVVIDPNQTETADVRLDRGAAISGTILYDDGSPADSVPIKLLHKDTAGKWIDVPHGAAFTPTTTTDDRGRYRIASLLPDEYMVQTTLQLADSKLVHAQFGGNQIQFDKQTFGSSLSFYGAGTPRIDDAASTHVNAGQERTGQDMTLPVAKLHTLTGKVLAGADAHPVNAAKVAIVYTDTGKQVATSSISRDDGLFHFDFIPDGDYTLRVTDARDVNWIPQPNTDGSPFPPADKEQVLSTYGGVDQPLLLRGDLYGYTATVPPPAQAQ